MTLEPGTWQSNTDLGLFPFSELHCMSLVNNLSFVAFLRKFKRMYKESESWSCLTLCLPMDYTVHRTLRVKILEWVAFPFSRGSSQPRDWTQVSCIAGGFFTNWATKEAQVYWNGYPIPSPVDLPYPGIEPGSPALQILYQLSYQRSQKECIEKKKTYVFIILNPPFYCFIIVQPWLLLLFIFSWL